jgi:hypothetical protein
MLSKILTLDFLSPYLGTVLRHGLSSVAGILVTAGFLAQGQADSWVAATLPVSVALVLWLWSIVGSWLNKWIGAK